MISDDELRNALRDLRSADEAAAPGVQAVLDRPRRVYSYDARRVVALGMAASVMVVCTATVARIALRPRLVVSEDVIAIATWKPGTDALLGSAGLSWYSAPLMSDRILQGPSPELPREQYP